MRVGIRQLRQNLSVYVRRVKAGETLEVTEHGRPVAVLAPLPKGGDPIARLEAQGRIARRATRRISDLPPPLEPAPGARPLSEILEELREDRL
jgi:prevent-host-death family protein